MKIEAPIWANSLLFLAFSRKPYVDIVERFINLRV